jgi:hypothetical protein
MAATPIFSLIVSAGRILMDGLFHAAWFRCGVGAGKPTPTEDGGDLRPFPVKAEICKFVVS